MDEPEVKVDVLYKCLILIEQMCGGSEVLQQQLAPLNCTHSFEQENLSSDVPVKEGWGRNTTLIVLLSYGYLFQTECRR